MSRSYEDFVEGNAELMGLLRRRTRRKKCETSYRILSLPD
jgi:hypothetical protein